MCLKALNIGPGDEVITVINTFYATVGAIEAVGATPVFCDCDSRYQIDVNLIEKKITKKTKAILPVHWGGASPNMPKIMNIAKKNLATEFSIGENALESIEFKMFHRMYFELLNIPVNE